MKDILRRLFFVLLFATTVSAQQPTGDQAKLAADKNAIQNQLKERRGMIKGRVVNDSGQGLANVGVNLFPIGAPQGQRRTISTDEAGKFEADDLSPAAYAINAYAPGYVIPGNPNERKYYRLGDEVTLTMIKGGVITGMVKNAAGDPVVGVQVSALRVRDAEGKPSTRGGSFARDRMTDDRGIYRLYGIEPGAYLIAAGGRANFYMGEMNKYADDVRTYHPSSTRETAAEVMVQNNQEVSAIDITYRGEKGNIVSGTVSAANLELNNASIGVTLMRATSGLVETNTNTPFRDSKNGFALYGVADGEYLIRAELFTPMTEKNRFSSQVRRVTVKGNDVSGLELALVPMASLSGILVLEQAAADSRAKCEKQRVATLEETLITLRKDSKGESLEQKWLNPGSMLAPNEKGEVTAYRLFAGNYRASINLPSETWYIKGQSLNASTTSNQPNYRNQQPSDVAGKGIAVKAGEQLASLTITIGEGAASLSGTVKAVSERQALPPRLRVYLVPSEAENANQVLRFFQSGVQFDGAFSFANLAPGKYFLLSRIGNEEELSDNTPRPIFWDTEGRALLRKEAEAINQSIELPPCKKVTDYALRHGLVNATVTPASKK